MRLLLILLLTCLPLLADPQAEPLGPLKLGMQDGPVVKALGPPKSKSKPIVEAATGLTISEWKWPGLTLWMGREKAGAPWTLERLHAAG